MVRDDYYVMSGQGSETEGATQMALDALVALVGHAKLLENGGAPQSLAVATHAETLLQICCGLSGGSHDSWQNAGSILSLS